MDKIYHRNERIEIMKNPYIGKDGRVYDSCEALKQANEEYFRRLFQDRNPRRFFNN